MSLSLSINDRFLFRWQWYVCGVLFPGRQGRICCYADWIMLEANIMSHFVCPFQRLIQALQMGHRLPLSPGHFNNPHLQYSTCCLHRDNFGTQKPTRMTWGKEPWRGRDPGATAPPHFIFHGKWVCLEFIYAWGWGSCSLLSSKLLSEHVLNLLRVNSVSASWCIFSRLANLQIIFVLFCIMQLKLNNMATYALRI